MATFLEKLNKTGHDTVPKVKDSTEISRINTLIQTEQNEQMRLFADIGRLYYDLEKENGSLNEPFVELFSNVSESNDKIASYQAEILKIKNVKRCPKCGRECSQDSVFCAGCGTQLPQEEKIPNGNHCTKCGAELAPDDAFCYNCGTKIER